MAMIDSYVVRHCAFHYHYSPFCSTDTLIGELSQTYRCISVTRNTLFGFSRNGCCQYCPTPIEKRLQSTNRLFKM